MTSETRVHRRRQRWVKAQSGQSLVILAIGFVALLGFVGIVTDVSLLFVRYSTLRRAVDAAAVASAGQFRRIFDETNNGIAEGEAESVANLNFAARQFIEFYGLNPSQVLVETCRAQGVEQRQIPPASGNFRPFDRAGNALYLYNASGVKTGDNPAADAALREQYEQLCTPDELKLVRVTAQIESPTVFLRLLGYPTITLTESAISQTAVIDVVMIIDVSESMLNETTYEQWETVNQGVRYLPQVVPQGDPRWTDIIDSTQATLDGLYPPSVIIPASGPAADDVQPRAECRVRAYPYSVYGGYRPYESLRMEYQNYLTGVGSSLDAYFPVGQGLGGSAAPRYSGFVPQYNFYGCCNDPDGNFRFDDAICQPFRSARDAAEGFLERLDFLRGDRIAYVTFDRRAYIVDPDGTGIQNPMIETERNLVTGSAATSRRGAWETLRDVIGVRGEPSFYTDGDPSTDADNDGYWDGFRNAGGRVTWTDLNNTQIGDLLDNPVAGNCPFQMAFMDLAYSNATLSPAGLPRTTTLLSDISSVPAWYSGFADQTLRRTKSYEFHASCAGTNIGGGLQAGSAALYQYGRREGAVWIMVMLSDGAAGASNIMARTNATGNLVLAQAANPYFVNASGYFEPQAGEYGGFGLCPYGDSTNPSSLITRTAFPRCGDTRAETRNFCGDFQGNPDLRAINATPNCNADFYDVDDYARDWADWIGLADLPGSATGTGTGRVGDQQLPTVFTIAFGLTYANPPATSGCSGADDCLRQGNVEDGLGEELLRYIADVGDNFRIDDDYQQRIMANRLPNPVTADPAHPNYTVRGPCEMPLSAPGVPPRGQYAPLTPELDCGNYFNAPDGARLQDVFNQIAARMFTRLSQ